MKETTRGTGPKFPIIVEKNGRIGRISFWKKTGVYGTYFRFGGKSRRSSFSTLEGARTHLESEFVKLDTNQVNSLTLYGGCPGQQGGALCPSIQTGSASQPWK